MTPGGGPCDPEGVTPALLLALSLPGPARAQDAFGLDGTQPHDLRIGIEPPTACESCHAGFQDAPIDAWEGSMMANALRDPLFLAALTIAEQDLPGVGDFCLRCHTPPGWLEGRCQPGDGSALIEEDQQGISCDVCHRMVEGPEGPVISNGQFFVADDTAKRGNLGATAATHAVTPSDYLASSELCGTCHEVSNPVLGDFPIELTYSEWEASAFKTEGKSCQSCHLKRVQGQAAAASTGAPVRTINVHRMVGGNTFIPAVLAGEHPELGRSEAFAATIADARALLQETAKVELVPAEVPAVAGQPTTFRIRVENGGGHKLPTGYPEGRRAWLEVVVTDAAGRELLRSGTWDPVEGELDLADPQLRTYEAKLGNSGVQNYHMVLQDELLFDSRIPPRGFDPPPHMVPVGREYPVQPDGTLAWWDLAPYGLVVPPDAPGPLTVRATLWYQTTTRSFVEFLRDENVTDDRGQRMYDLWVKYGKSPPAQMARVEGTIELTRVLPRPTPEPEARGCAQASGTAAAGLLALALVRRRRDRAPR